MKKIRPKHSKMAVGPKALTTLTAVATLVTAISADCFVDLNVSGQNESVPQALREKNLAYVLFTPGTTGEPKGVQIGRESVAALAEWMAKDFAPGDAPVFLNQAPFSFDLSMYEVFGTLTLGGTIVLASRQMTAQGGELLATLARYGVTTWVSTPSFAQQQLLNPHFSQEGLASLTSFLVCGEVLPVTLARHLRQRFQDYRGAHVKTERQQNA